MRRGDDCADRGRSGVGRLLLAAAKIGRRWSARLDRARGHNREQDAD
jgi:hypothetical protein